MKTLSQIIVELDEVIAKLELTSVEVQSLKLFLANALYKNEALGSSIALESSPLTCVNLNSAIEHAAKKNYKVFRGKNPRIAITGILPTRNFNVKKYDVFLDIQGYQLVYADDYNFSVNLPAGEQSIELILTKEVISGEILTSNKYSFMIEGPCSEDIQLYEKVGDDEVRLEVKNKIEANNPDSTIYQVTISDFGVKFLSLGKFYTETTIHYKYLPLIDESDLNILDILNSISAVPDFRSAGISARDLRDQYGYYGIEAPTSYPTPIGTAAFQFYAISSRATGNTITYYDLLEYRGDPETDKDKIYLESVINMNVGNAIRATSDLEEALIPLTSEYYSKINCVLEDNGQYKVLKLYYILRKAGNYPPKSWRDEVAESIKKMYYNDDLTIDGADFREATTPGSMSSGTIEYSATENMDSFIQDLVEDYCHEVLGGTFNPYELLFYLQRNLGNKVTYLGPKLDGGTFWTTQINLEDNETIDLSSLITIMRK